MAKLYPFALRTVLGITATTLLGFSGLQCANPKSERNSTRAEVVNANEDSEETTYHTIEEVVQDRYLTFWAKTDAKTVSSVLHFNLSNPAKLSVEFSPECWAEFPIKVIDKKVVVYWDDEFDAKYNLAVVKAMRQVPRRFEGKPFIILELGNHNTLLATYPAPELVEKLNRADKNRLLFPDRYMAKRLY